MYLIIVGAGDIGIQLIDVATAGGNEVVVIERDRDRAERAANRYDCLVLHDDATNQETLVDAGIDQSDAVISTTDRDATNIMVSLLAGEFDVPEVVSVVQDPHHMAIFERIGVHTMQNPQRLIADYLYRAVERPAVIDYMSVGETAEVFEIHVSDEAPIEGLTLSEAGDSDILTDDMLLVAIEREEGADPITPRGNTTIQAGDLVTVYAQQGATPRVTDIFGHFDDSSPSREHGR